MESIEATGETVEEAVSNGIKSLGVGPGDVMVEVLEEPSRGIFGIGAREARVRLTMIGRRVPPPPAPAPKPVSAPPAPQSKPDFDYDIEDEDFPATQAAVSDEELDEEARITREVLLELLEKMHLSATISVRRAEASRDGEEASRDGEEAPWVLNITGKNARNLIGRRGETLASLQYITRLIASRRLQHRTNVIVDAAAYKSERSDRLRSLAFRMADQAVKQGRTVTLEPMPPNERRIIHLALRNRQDVMTKSIGEGNSRKVTIVPSK